MIHQLQKALEEEQKKRHHFYETVSEQQKSEFINGEVIVSPPVRIEHNEVNGNLYKIIDTYVVDHELGFVGMEKIMIQLTRNDYEPDLCFFQQEKADTFKRGQKFFPAPDLIVEVLSKSTEKRDRGIKFKDYQKHQVQEYWIVDPQQQTLERYSLEKGKYQLALKSKSGTVETPLLPDLCVPIKTIFSKKHTNRFIKTL